MADGVQLAYGQIASGRLISITEAERGAACGCVCPGCGTPLIAKKGTELAHHFAHEADADCAGAVESELHKLGKQTIADTGQVWYPEIIARSRGAQKYIAGEAVFQAAAVELEPRLEGIQPDAILIHENGRQLAVEIYVTHAVSPEKALRYRDLELPCIEIDLSEHHGAHRLRTPPDLLPDIILRSAPRRWVFSPRLAVAETVMRAEQEAEDAARERRRAELEAAHAAKEAERIRLLTEDQRREESRRRAAHEAFVAQQAEWQQQEAERFAISRAKWEKQEHDRLAALAVARAKTKAYRDAERAEAAKYASKPTEWRFALRLLASKFLLEPVADAWLENQPSGAIPDAATLDATYDNLWAEIKRQGRYHGP